MTTMMMEKGVGGGGRNGKKRGVIIEGTKVEKTGKTTSIES